MSTEQEISGVEREAQATAWRNFKSPLAHKPDYVFDRGWREAKEYFTDPAYCVSCGGPCRDESPDPLEQAEVLEVACAEQRQRADMAEERESDIRKEIEDASSDASLCDNAEKLEALTLGLLKLASGGQYRES